MQRIRRPVLTGIVAGAVVLVAGCSDPAPTQVPGPAASSAAAPSVGPSTVAPSPTASSSSPAPAATSAQPGPTSGSDPSVEPNRPVETAAPKQLDQPTRTAGAVVSLVSVRATTVKATTPGDRSGPGVLVRLRLVNSTGRTLDTSFTQVSLTGPGGTSGTLVDGAPTRRLTGSLRAGRQAEGTYAFLLGGTSSGNVTVAVFVTAGQAVVQFRGRAS